jgi:threonine dehydrogenase-like Zn-dependent dehydrogenase
LSLQDAPDGYSTFLKKEQACIKVVLDPWGETHKA